MTWDAAGVAPPASWGGASGRPATRMTTGLVVGVGRPAGKLQSGPRVNWVTMSDSCHTGTARISESRESRPDAVTGTARTPVPAGFPGIVSRRLGDHRRRGPE